MTAPDLMSIRKLATAIEQRVSLIRRSPAEHADWHLTAIVGMCKAISAAAVAPPAGGDDAA